MRGRPVSSTMKRVWCSRFAATLGVLIVANALAATSERVDFPSLDADPATQLPIRVEAFLYRPDGAAPESGWPAIVALHGCSGMYSARPGHERELAPGYVQRAEAFVAAGYVVLLPDSFGARGRREVCTIKRGESSVAPMVRRFDARGALRYLAALPGIDRERIALVGYSHGGSTVLATINARDPALSEPRSDDGKAPHFRAAVAFYPGCRGYLDAGSRWEPAVATQIHIGEQDDWTPAEPCIALGKSMRGRDPPLSVSVYPDSQHGFDSPVGRIFVRKDVTNGVRPGEGVTLGPNPEARATANARVTEFLRDALAR